MCSRRDKMKKIKGGVTAAKGFEAASAAAGIKYQGRTDMALVYSQKPCEAAGTFTTNVVKAAPVKWDKKVVEKEILNERARELYLERKRWPDLLRFHFGGTIDVYQEVPNLKKKAIDNIIIPLYLAIPLSDMNINPNLKQTQGYENL
jgi:hypothetical protein